MFFSYSIVFVSSGKIVIFAFAWFLRMTDEAIESGHAIYSKGVLSLYDFWVLGLSNRFIWQCPTPVILEWFNQYVSGNHLDIGVGTGYFLSKCQFPEETPERLVLMDMNIDCLEVCANRVDSYFPKVLNHNAFDSLPRGLQPFESVSMNFLLHCLPGPIQEKSTVFENVYPYLEKGGRVFGSTILGSGVPRSASAKMLMNIYNQKGIFSNLMDDWGALEKALENNFDWYEIKLNGCVALFVGGKSE